MSDELKPCNFCSSKNLVIHGLPFTAWVACQKCFACGPVCKYEQEAIDAWNRGNDEPV